MSDEYASTGYKGSLVNSTMNEAPNKKQPSSLINEASQASALKQHGQGMSDYETHNYPSVGDSTAEGGYGSSANVWSGRAQRGNKTGTGTYKTFQSSGTHDEGLTNQGKDGEPLRDQYDAEAWLRDPMFTQDEDE